MSPVLPNPLRVGVLLSGGGRTLLNLLEQIKAGALPVEIAVVIASRSCKGLDHARQADLETHLVSYKDSASAAAYSDGIAAILDKARVELVCMAGFLSFWHIPARYQGKVVNIHPALLPAFGGKGMHGHHVHKAVLRTGCKVSGCTVHFVTNEYDQGPIILQRCVKVLEGDDADSLAARVFEQECIALPEALRLCQQGRLKVQDGVVHVLADSPAVFDRD